MVEEAQKCAPQSVACKLVLLMQPSSAVVEHVFHSYKTDLVNNKPYYIETSIMLHKNTSVAL